MATTTQQPGNGVDRPVIPLQNQEPEIEIIEDTEAAKVKAGDEFPHQPDDKDRAGSYEYDKEDDAPADARTGREQQTPTGGDDDQLRPGETQEQLTARQRRRRRDNAARQRERAELLQLRETNARLLQQVSHVDNRLSNVEKAGIDGQIASIDSEIQRANIVMKRAMEAQNADDFVQAQEIRDVLRDRLVKLKAQKEQQAEQTPAQQQQQQPLPRVRFQQVFMSRMPWFDPRNAGHDKDASAVLQIDREMMAEGLSPDNPQYWPELERRIQEDLPHRFQAANDGDQGGGRQQQARGGPVANGRKASGGPKLPGSGAGPSGAGGGVQKFHLSAVRKQAMVDAGIWDDPEKKMRQIKYYMKWDAENPST